MGMLKELGIAKTVTCMTTDTAAKMKNGIVEHMPGMEWLGRACHKAERTVQNFVGPPGLKKSISAFTKVATHLQKSALWKGVFQDAQQLS
ncbi:unnamed protein product [Ectocarpus sp. CCAP 1310/34]|nr:unnamed protein product [Ectocarpus sp. CCAP 1310/34]